jgi:hypothetical protein
VQRRREQRAALALQPTVRELKTTLLKAVEHLAELEEILKEMEAEA